MGMRAGLRAGVVALALLGAGCGGGGGDDDEQAADTGAAATGGPVVDLDPCALLDRGTAAALSGAAVDEPDDEPVGTALAASIGCSYRTSGSTGGAIAARLVLAAGTEEPEGAKDARVAELTASLDDPAVEEVDLGDAGALVTTDEVVQVVYVVEEVVVSVEVAPPAGVDDGVVESVLEFTETTVEPVRRALEEKQRDDREVGTTTTPAPDDDPDAASGDDDVVQTGEIEGLWTGDWGTMAIEVDGDQVRAAYTHDDGRITGTFEDGVFRGRWTEIPTREGPNDAGEVEFRFAKTGDDTIALDGRWDYDGEADPLTHDDWDLTLSPEAVPDELRAAFEDDEGFEAP
jgi:hypothetical protein